MPSKETISTSVASALSAFLGVIAAMFTLTTTVGDRLWVTRNEFSQAVADIRVDIASLKSDIRIRENAIIAQRIRSTIR